MTLEEILNSVKQLSLVDKVRLIEKVAPDIEKELLTLRLDETKPNINMIDYLLENPIQVDNLIPLKRDEIYER